MRIYLTQQLETSGAYQLFVHGIPFKYLNHSSCMKQNMASTEGGVSEIPEGYNAKKDFQLVGNF